LLYISNLSENQSIKGKVLINDSLEECIYDKRELCVPKGYELKCTGDLYDTCEEGNIIEEGNDGKCGEGYGKCPSGQCCNKDGQCGTSEDHCLVSKNCQINYGDCIDECEQIYNYLKSTDEYRYLHNPVPKCVLNEKGKVKEMYVYEIFIIL